MSRTSTAHWLVVWLVSELLFLCRFCPVTAPWNHRRVGETIRRLHRRGIRHWGLHHWWPFRWLLKIVFACLWPLNATLQTIFYTWTYGGVAKREVGKSFIRQAAEQIGLAFVDFIPPRSYYCYRLYDDSNRRRASEYLLTCEQSGLLAYLNDFYRRCDWRTVEDKRTFAAFCQRHGFPTAPLIAELSRGEFVKLSDEEETLPKSDFIVKPVHGMKGNFVQRWVWIGEDRYRDEHGAVMSEAELIRQLRAQSQKRDLLLQRRLHNHPELAGVTNGSLSTVRILTVRTEGGHTEVVIAVLKMPVGSSVADNFAQGGIASPIDLETGVLGAAVSKSLKDNRLSCHPETNGTIAGLQLPYWRESLEIACRAHDEIKGYFSLGWDLAITADGPALLEPNDGWCVELFQRPHDLPLGATRFADLCEAKLVPNGA